MGIILFLFFAASIGATVFFVHRRYTQVQKSNQVNPNRLLESGRIEPRNVLIISNVDNRHHIDVVLGISKYLKVSHVFVCLFVCGKGRVVTWLKSHPTTSNPFLVINKMIVELGKLNL